MWKRELFLHRALKTRGNTPKYGLIFHSTFIGRAGAKNKGRISRYLANKCTIASRIDCFSGEWRGLCRTLVSALFPKSFYLFGKIRWQKLQWCSYFSSTAFILQVDVENFLLSKSHILNAFEVVTFRLGYLMCCYHMVYRDTHECVRW